MDVPGSWRHRWLVIPFVVGVVVVVALGRPALVASDALDPTSFGAVVAIVFAASAFSLPALLLHVSLAKVMSGRSTAQMQDERWSMFAGWGTVVGFGLSAAMVLLAWFELTHLGAARIASALVSALILLWSGGEVVFSRPGGRSRWARVAWSGGAILAIGIAAGLVLERYTHTWI